MDNSVTQITKTYCLVVTSYILNNNHLKLLEKKWYVLVPKFSEYSFEMYMFSKYAYSNSFKKFLFFITMT